MEETKFKADLTSTHPVSATRGGRHTFVPFAMEDRGKIGAHGHAVLRMLAEHAVAREKLSPRSRDAAPPPSGCGIVVGPDVAAAVILMVAPYPVPPGSAVS